MKIFIIVIKLWCIEALNRALSFLYLGFLRISVFFKKRYDLNQSRFSRVANQHEQYLVERNNAKENQ